MQPYRKTDALMQELVDQVFHTPRHRVRRALEVGDDDALTVTAFTLVEELADLTGLPKTQIYTIVGTSQPTSSRERRAGTLAPVDVADRALQVTELFARVVAVLGRDKARAWIVRPNGHLDGKAPVDLMRTSTGRDRLARYLDSLEDVTYG
ncbi:antitoxin Xre/MbcA/ParS toxin-binding domain-containing protein [Deinococcus pimensis]|uniref:antitoxin Xre/MbcA/ParS toxin-binding domain-containing protein n=1 Tax=Deinococcus pimensis TaxID=309888 RepID=UPI0004818A6B|nr:antitoxin Xre/MbcA/ParS toxin-binding domain-containing protein [Deinococcus pimensis]